jgi:hypothetical protein
MLRDRDHVDEQWLLIDRVETGVIYAPLGIIIPRCEEEIIRQNGIAV